MKLSERISLKKSLWILILYGSFLIAIGFFVFDLLFPIRDAKLASDVGHYKQVIDNDPNNTNAHFKLGQIYHEIGTDQKNSWYLHKAESEYKKSLASNPDNIEVHEYLGQLYSETGKPEKSRQEYEIILTVDPKHVAATYNLGILAYREGDFTQAINFLKRTVELQPTAGNVYYELGKIYEQTNQFEQAKEMYQKALEYIPNLKDASERLQSLTGKQGTK